MKAFGRAARGRVRVYLTGGASAVLLGWRPSTLDIDLRFEPEQDALYRAIASLKDTLGVNVELVTPADFVPEVPGWAERSVYIATEGQADFYHYDFYAQALAKLERGHHQDVEDVRCMVRDGLVEPSQLLALFETIEERLYRYPALSAVQFRRAVEEFLAKESRPGRAESGADQGDAHRQIE